MLTSSSLICISRRVFSIRWSLSSVIGSFELDFDRLLRLIWTEWEPGCEIKLWLTIGVNCRSASVRCSWLNLRGLKSSSVESVLPEIFIEMFCPVGEVGKTLWAKVCDTLGTGSVIRLSRSCFSLSLLRGRERSRWRLVSRRREGGCIIAPFLKLQNIISFLKIINLLIKYIFIIKYPTFRVSIFQVFKGVVVAF